MDISPLPHKQPYFAQIEVQSPTPVSTPDLEVTMESSPPRPEFLEAPRPTQGIEYADCTFHNFARLIYFLGVGNPYYFDHL